MFLPVTIKAHAHEHFEPERVLKCICGKEAPMKNMLLVWTHPVGSEEYCYYPVHQDSDCFTTYVSQGSC